MTASSSRRSRRAPGTRRATRKQGEREPALAPDRLRAVATFLVGCLLVGTALVFDPAARDSFRLPKLLLAETLGLASLVPLLLAARRRAGEPVPWRSTALLAAAPLLVAAALSAATSRHPEAVRDGLWHAAVAAACWVGWSAGLGRRRLRRLLDWLLLPAAALAGVGLLQAAGLFEPVRPLAPLGPRFEMVSLAGNVGDLAMYLALPTLVALGGWFDRRGWRRLGFGLLLGLFAGTLLLARTLTVLAAVAVGCLVVAALRLDRRRFGRFAALFLLAGGVGLALVPGLRERVRESAEALARAEVNTLLSGRLDGWRAAAWMFGEHPVSGVGVGAFATEYSPARLALLAAGGAPDPQSFESFDSAHNELLQVAAEQGVIGLLALLASLAVAARALRGRRGSGAAGGDRALAGGGLATLAVVALADFPFQIALTAFPAWLFLAWLLAEQEGEAPA